MGSGQTKSGIFQIFLIEPFPVINAQITQNVKFSQYIAL